MTSRYSQEISASQNINIVLTFVEMTIENTGNHALNPTFIGVTFEPAIS